jgi:hypothetical protein
MTCENTKIIGYVGVFKDKWHKECVKNMFINMITMSI